MISDPSKGSVPIVLTEGLRNYWGDLPETGVPVTNYLKCQVARGKCRNLFKNQGEIGRMLDGTGWSAQIACLF